MQPIDHQREFAGLLVDVAHPGGKAANLDDIFRSRLALLAVKDAPLVIGAEAKPPDQTVRGLASGAAIAIGTNDLATAMLAQAIGPALLGGWLDHRRNSRWLCCQAISPRAAFRRSSQLPSALGVNTAP